MSPEAVGQRLETLRQLWELTVSLQSVDVPGRRRVATHVSDLIHRGYSPAVVDEVVRQAAAAGDAADEG